jgi:hypothetical protein
MKYDAGEPYEEAATTAHAGCSNCWLNPRGEKRAIGPRSNVGSESNAQGRRRKRAVSPYGARRLHALRAGPGSRGRGGATWRWAYRTEPGDGLAASKSFRLDRVRSRITRPLGRVANTRRRMARLGSRSSRRLADWRSKFALTIFGQSGKPFASENDGAKLSLKGNDTPPFRPSAVPQRSDSSARCVRSRRDQRTGAEIEGLGLRKLQPPTADAGGLRRPLPSNSVWAAVATTGSGT